MKRILSGVILMLVLSVPSYGAVSPDMVVYVRQDVFDAKMEAMFERLHGEIVGMQNAIMGEIKELKSEVRRVDKQIDDLRQDIYLGLVILGLLAAFPAVKEFFKWREERKQELSLPFTLEDVKQLISTAIAEAQLSGRAQA